MLRVSKRLIEIAQMVSAKRLIDIGTDHGLLPIYTLEQDIVSRAIGVDKSALALGQARVNRERSFEGEKLELICSDGLEQITLDEGDCLVLAGMGGVLITTLLDNPKIRNCSQIITQANTDVPLVRSVLSKKGWKMEKESILKHQKHCYITISWRVGQQKLTKKEITLGELLREERPKLWFDWLKKERKRILKIQTARGEGRLSSIQHQLLIWLEEEIGLE